MSEPKFHEGPIWQAQFGGHLKVIYIKPGTFAEALTKLNAVMPETERTPLKELKLTEWSRGLIL